MGKTKQTTNAVYNLTVGKAVNATVYKVKMSSFGAENGEKEKRDRDKMT